MWPIHALLNKLLKVDVHEEDDDMSWAALFNFCSRNGNLGRSHFVKVPHIKQLRSWDCGLACVLMVLKTLGLNHYDHQDLEELCRTTSIWTVDLAYLLRKLSVRFLFFTVTIGANPDFSVETFYKEQLANDIGRVDMLFQRSIEEGIKIEHRSIKGEEIIFLILSGKFIVIALVDQCILSQPWREDVRMPRFYEGTAAYTGHYVVICGYDAHTDEFEIRDPASPRESDRISSKCLEEARKSYGTDEDILLNVNIDLSSYQFCRIPFMRQACQAVSNTVPVQVGGVLHRLTSVRSCMALLWSVKSPESDVDSI
ncbi:GUCD1-like protein [Tanacetum coccineum]